MRLALVATDCNWIYSATPYATCFGPYVRKGQQLRPTRQLVWLRCISQSKHVAWREAPTGASACSVIHRVLRRVDLGALDDNTARFAACGELRLARVGNAMPEPWTIAATIVGCVSSLERCFVLLGDAYRYELTDLRACLVLADSTGPVKRVGFDVADTRKHAPKSLICGESPLFACEICVLLRLVYRVSCWRYCSCGLGCLYFATSALGQ